MIPVSHGRGLSSDRTATVHSPLLPVLAMPHELSSAVNRITSETIVISLCLKRTQSIAEMDTWTERDNIRSAHPKTLKKLIIKRTLKSTVLADTYDGSKK